MKKTIIALLLSAITVATMGMSALAAPRTLSNGVVFDPEFYAATYPDVAAAFGHNEQLLEQHYMYFGAAEGRVPSKAASDAYMAFMNQLPQSQPAAGGTVTVVSTNASKEGLEVLNLVNNERALRGLPPLAWDDQMASVANLRAQEIVQLFSHTRPNGSSCFTVYPQNYASLAENIASGQRNAVEVMTSWMNSPGHRNNILNTANDRLGVGIYEVNGRKYWVQAFVRYR